MFNKYPFDRLHTGPGVVIFYPLHFSVLSVFCHCVKKNVDITFLIKKNNLSYWASNEPDIIERDANAVVMSIPPPTTTESGDREQSSRWQPYKAYILYGEGGITLLGV